MLGATEQSIDTAIASGKALLDLLGIFAKFENNLCRERKAEGIRRAKARGVYKGRSAIIRTKRIREMRDAGRTPTEAAREMGIGRASVYRVLATAAPEHGKDFLPAAVEPPSAHVAP